MKTLFILVMTICSIQWSVAQYEEFPSYPNGLIYSDETMDKLSYIVDSLNLQYRTCNVDQNYYAKQQALAHYVRLEGIPSKQVIRDLDQNITWEAFLKKYPQVVHEENLLIVKSKYEGYASGTSVKFTEVNLTSNYGRNIYSAEDPEIYDRDLTGKWLYHVSKKTSYSNAHLKALYFPDGFKSPLIPSQYARMIGYADCLIDTMHTKMFEESEEGWVDLPPNWREFSDEDQQRLLQELRQTRVIGFCSQDSRPRHHAINIALLAAETHHWEIFLRAHLDILNDRFDRMSDGSYAWKERQTYIQELEELRIQVNDLMFGIALRMENPATNHYFGSVSRIGRALAETQNHDLVKQGILRMITDHELDDYNRMIAYFLFLNYNQYIQDEDQHNENGKALQKAILHLPEYMQQQINEKD